MKKKNRYRNPRAQVGTAGLTDPLTRLWMWRTVSAIGMKRLAPRNLDSLDDDILHACGLLHRLRDEGSPKLTHAEAERVVRERVRAAPIPARRGVLHRNVERLGRLLALDALERDLLTYLVRLATCQPFRALAEAMNNSAEVERVLAIALQATPARIHAVLRPESTLVGSGLLGPKGCVDMYEEPIEMLDGLTSALLERHTSDASLLRRFFRRAPAGTLELKAYGHVGDGVDIAHALLASAATGGQRGLNVLLHGPAGTGKTELARRKPPFTFDASLLNTTPPASDLVAQLLVRREASVLLHGLPGTGKTEFARHLAAAAGVPLLAKRASDLLGSYVGQTEKALASMFREAREQGAFLLLDEADTFLRERAGARHSWEVSQVNELLVQMEGFDGVFFCATNHIDDLDAAAFRRFDLKVRCDPLTADGRRRLAVLAFSDLALDVQNEVGAGVEALDGLCIGDVVAVRRGLLLSSAVSAIDVLSRLRDELARRRQRPRIGF